MVDQIVKIIRQAKGRAAAGKEEADPNAPGVVSNSLKKPKLTAAEKKRDIAAAKANSPISGTTSYFLATSFSQTNLIQDKISQSLTSLFLDLIKKNARPGSPCYFVDRDPRKDLEYAASLVGLDALFWVLFE